MYQYVMLSFLGEGERQIEEGGGGGGESVKREKGNGHGEMKLEQETKLVKS